MSVCFVFQLSGVDFIGEGKGFSRMRPATEWSFVTTNNNYRTLFRALHGLLTDYFHLIIFHTKVQMDMRFYGQDNTIGLVLNYYYYYYYYHHSVTGLICTGSYLSWSYSQAVTCLKLQNNKERHCQVQEWVLTQKDTRLRCGGTSCFIKYWN